MMLSRLACILICVYAFTEQVLGQDGLLRWHRPLAMWPISPVVEHEFDPTAREALVSGYRPSLTATELGILEILMRRYPGVADRRSIAQHVWDYEADAFGSNTIDVHLARLRSKLAGAGARIETVRGVGYRMVAS